MTEGLKALASIAVALIASAVCMLVAGRFRPRRLAGQGRPRAQGARASVVAVVIGAISGYAVLGLWPRLPPANALDRFLVIVLPATVALLAVGHLPLKARALRWGLVFALAVVLVRILLHASVYLQEGAREVGILLLGSAGILVGVLSLVQKLWIRRRHIGDNDGGGQASISLALAAALFAAGLLIAMAGYIKGGSAALPWSAAIAGATIGSRLGSQDADLRGIVSLSVVLLFGFLFIGRFFGELTTSTALLVLFTPLLCWTSQLPWLRRCAPRTRDLLSLALVAASLLAVLLWAKQTFDREMAPLISHVTSRVNDGPRTAYLFGQLNSRTRFPSGSNVFTSRSPSGSRAGWVSGEPASSSRAQSFGTSSTSKAMLKRSLGGAVAGRESSAIRVSPASSRA